MGIAEAGAHALRQKRRHLVRRVAGEKHAPLRPLLRDERAELLMDDAVKLEAEIACLADLT